MNVTVIGAGFVGVVTSAVYAELGHVVVGLDVDADKVAALNEGKPYFYEPGLEELLARGIKAKRLAFTTRYEGCIPQSEVVVIAVGTPSAKNGTADLSAVISSAKTLAPLLQQNTVVALKSTVPPGTHTQVAEVIRKHTSDAFFVASLPEFLREGSAVKDTLEPSRVVIGASEKRAISVLTRLHQGLEAEVVVVSPESAQMAKYTANAYLAQRITFINQIANLCERNGAFISEVIEVIGKDPRIGSHYWYPGLGYGGSCFPKDVKELAAYAKSIGEGQGLLPKIDELNEERLPKKMAAFEKSVGGFEGKRVAVLGLAFKPNTNDVRFAPSIPVVRYLTKKKALVTGYDPQVGADDLVHFPGMAIADDPYRAASEADVVLLLVEWDELIKLDLNKMSDICSKMAYFIDTRNQYGRRTVEKAGMRYIGIGNG
jgi:UDPglucose 6-dehydrogenase